MNATPHVIADSEQASALDHLHEFLAQRKRALQPVADLAAFERDLRKRVAAVEREAIATELARFDLDVPQVIIEGTTYTRVLRAEQTYMSGAGPVRVERSLYRAKPDEPALAVLERRAGIIAGFWTPHAAELGAFVVAQVTAGEGEALFARLGAMTPSRSALERLPKVLSAQWEQDRVAFEDALRQPHSVPARAAVLAVSLDGVMVPMRDGQRAAKRTQMAAEGKHQRGPAGYREASCGTLSVFDVEGKRLDTIRFARMPEAGKATLKQSLVDEVAHALGGTPEMRLVKLADGARDNWTFLSKTLPDGVEIVDFFHAAEHLDVALQAAYGATGAQGRAEFERLRHALRWHKRGVGEVIAALKRLHTTFPRREAIEREWNYFRNNRERMKYAQWAAEGLPIGSGVVEAACKTLVTQRLKRSGMRWREAGGQAILTLRGWIQSDRFDDAWALLMATFKGTVTLPPNLIAFPRSTSPRASV